MTSLAVQWLRLPLLPMQGARVRSLVRELRSRMPRKKKKRSFRKPHSRVTSNRKASSPRRPLTWSQKLRLSLSPNQSLAPRERPAPECSGKADLSHHIPLRKSCPALVSTCHQTFRFLSVSPNETSVPGRRGLGFAQPYRTKMVPSTQWVFQVNEEANPVITLRMARVKPREGEHLPRATGFTCR